MGGLLLLLRLEAHITVSMPDIARCGGTPEVSGRIADVWILSLRATCSNRCHGPPAGATILRTPFAVGDGVLAVEGRRSGLPVHYALWYEANASRVRFRALGDLFGRVRLTSPSAAPGFVRLLTSPRTVSAIDPPWEGVCVEVVQRTTMTEAYTCGDGPVASWIKSGGPGFWGTITRHVDLPHAVVRQDGRGYRIERTLACARD